MVELLVAIIVIWTVFGVLGLGITLFYVIRSQPREFRLHIPEIHVHSKENQPLPSNDRAIESYQKLQKYLQEEAKKAKESKKDEEEEKSYSEVLFEAVDDILKGGSPE